MALNEKMSPIPVFAKKISQKFHLRNKMATAAMKFEIGATFVSPI